MHCYQALETAATNIIRRNPAWLNTSDARCDALDATPAARHPTRWW